MSVSDGEFRDLSKMVVERCRQQVIDTALLFEGDEKQILALILMVAIEMLKGAIKCKVEFSEKKISRKEALKGVMGIIVTMAQENRI